MEPLEVIMEYYNNFIPHIYIPEPAVMEVSRKLFFVGYLMMLSVSRLYSIKENC
jgi:hypothetical protein